MNLRSIRRLPLHGSGLGWLPLLLLLMGASACTAPGQRRHPDWDRLLAPIRTLSLMPPDIRVFEASPDGRLHPRQDLSRQASDLLIAALTEEFRARNFRILAIPGTQGPGGEDAREIAGLYQAVHRSIQRHTFGPEVFPVKRDRFEYSVGNLEGLLAREHADGALFVRALLRFGDRGARGHLSLGLADPSGSILWYGADGIEAPSKENPTEHLARLTGRVMAGFPGRAP